MTIHADIPDNSINNNASDSLMTTQCLQMQSRNWSVAEDGVTPFFMIGRLRQCGPRDVTAHGSA